MSDSEDRQEILDAMYARGVLRFDEYDSAALPTQGAGIRGATADAVKDYLRQIAGAAPLSEEQEFGLCEVLAEGVRAKATLDSGVSISQEARLKLSRSVKDGEKAKNDLVASNQRLIVSVAKSQIGKGLPFLDLIQEGNIGLIHAIARFDHTRGYRFATYAIWWIRQAMSRAIDNQSREVRLPVHVEEDIKKIERAQKKLFSSLEHDPSINEIGAEIQMSADDVERLLNLKRGSLSLFSPMDETGELQLLDVLQDEHQETVAQVVETGLLLDQIEDALESLSEREAAVIRARFGFADGVPLTLEEIGNRFGVTRERIRQIEAKAMSKLKHPSQANLLRDFLEN